MDVRITGPSTTHSSRSGPIDPMPEASTSATASLKRSAAEAFEDTPDEETSHKKARDSENIVMDGDGRDDESGVDGAALADNLEEELQCGCCSAIVYRPVVVAPCQHFFCGRCVGVDYVVGERRAERRRLRCVVA